jgi:hypothetical protein
LTKKEISIRQTVKLADNQHFIRQQSVIVLQAFVKLVDFQIVMRQPTKNVVRWAGVVDNMM